MRRVPRLVLLLAVIPAVLTLLTIPAVPIIPRLILLQTVLGQSATQSSDRKDAPSPATSLSPAEGAEREHSSAALSISPGDILGEARFLYSRGELEGAIGKYEEYVNKYPESAEGYAGLVRVYLKEKNADRAAEIAGKGMTQANSPRMRSARAEVLFRQGKIFDAETEWVSVVNSGNPDARALLGLARVRRAIAMYKSEKAMLDRAHALDPNDSDIEEEWMGTLSRAERMKYLEDGLANGNNWDADKREDVENYLKYLKERARQNSNPCRLVSNVKATETPLVKLLVDPTHMRGYGLGVAINGHKSSLMLDTGASGILLRRNVAERAGVTRISEMKVGGIGDKGRREGYFGVAQSIRIGALEFQNCSVEVIEGRNIVGEEGLIGADVFASFLVDLDFPNEKLKLSQLPPRPGEVAQDLTLKSEHGANDDEEDLRDEKKGDGKIAETKSKATNAGQQDRYIAPEMQAYTRIYRFGHALLIPTAVGKVQGKLFLLDTGSEANFISPAAAREVTKVHDDSDRIVKGISGRVENVYSANKAVLSFGNLRQENQDMTAFDTKNFSDDLGTEVSGFLGFMTLRFLDIKIDYRDALVHFDYDEKRWWNR